MKKIIFAFALLVAFGVWGESVAKQSPVLIELYTSQGCSSCPPADRFAGELAKRSDVVVLSLPVTYWDRLGWKDSLASPQWTKRQRRYASRMGERIVYTPQMVIDGKFHAVGSSRAKVYRLIKQRRNENKQAPIIQVKQIGNKLLLTINPTAKPKKVLKVWRVDFIRKKPVAIGSGENGGRTVTYYHVARHLSALSNWQGAAKQQKLKIKSHTDGVAFFIQEENHGEVLASASILLK